MGTFTLTQPKVWIDGFSIDANLFATTQEYSVEQVDDTVFGTAGTRSFAAGLKAHNFVDRGYFEAGTDEVDEIAFNRVGLTNVVRSVSPEGGTEGNAAYTTRLLVGRYNPFDGSTVGEMHSFTLEGQNKGDPLVRGTLIHNATQTATGTGTAFQVGSVSATQTAYASLHVTAASGTSPTLDVVIESDDASGMASPTTRITFAQQTTTGSAWQTVAGAITDDWWRVNYTIGGTSPSFTFVVVLGIL